METVGKQKQQLSEKLRQQKERESAEVERLALEIISQLRVDLTAHVRTELSTTISAIKEEIGGLPQLITGSTKPLQTALNQATQQAHDSIVPLKEVLNQTKQRANDLPQQVRSAIEPMEDALRQIQQEASTIKILSRNWLKSFLLGIFLIAGLGLGSWGLLSWMGHEVQRLNSEISRAKTILQQLPEGVRFYQTPDGRRFIVATKLGVSFERPDGVMAVEVEGQ